MPSYISPAYSTNNSVFNYFKLNYLMTDFLKQPFSIFCHCRGISVFGTNIFSILFFSLQDVLVMALHHIVTLFLLWTSWCMNFVRIGMVVTILHNAADIPLEVNVLYNLQSINSFELISLVSVLSSPFDAI